jgi:hypothetical protein
MPFSKKQKELIEKHLHTEEAGAEQPTATIKVTRRDLAFLLQAIQYYHDMCCPGEGHDAQCAMVTWGEDVHTGAIEMSCPHRCQEWIEELLSDAVLSQFKRQ